jgi:hypothetical protein
MRISTETNTKMRRPITAFAVYLLIVLLPGCGSDSPAGLDGLGDLPPSPGQGSLAMKVVARVEGLDTGADAYQTDFTVTVTDTLGAAVSGARVTVGGAFGTVTLTEDEAEAGTYASTRTGYVLGSYTLDVRSGPDSLVGVTEVAPAVHAITTPTPNSVVPANTALNVQWKRPATADQCRLETRDYDSDWIYGDPGTLWTPTIGNPPRADQRIRVTRRNVQVTTFGLPGSQLSVSIRKTVEPVVAE